MSAIKLLHHLSVISNQRIVADIDFTVFPKGWQLTQTNHADARLQASGYKLENKTDNHWQYYHLPFPLSKNENFLISCKFSILEANKNSQFGIVWGFDEAAEQLNRFTISLNSAYFKLAHFNRKNFIAIHQFRGKHKRCIEQQGINELHMLNINGHYFFYINDESNPVYQCSALQFPLQGNRVGFFIEPSMQVSVKRLFISKLECAPVNELDIAPLFKLNGKKVVA